MFGICVAVNATTSIPSTPRKATLKLWKSRPAAPAITTRLLVMERSLCRAGGRRLLVPLLSRAHDFPPLPAVIHSGDVKRVGQHRLGAPEEFVAEERDL